VPAEASGMTAATAVALVEERAGRDRYADAGFRMLMGGAALLVLMSLLGAAISMFWGGREAFATFGWGFLTSSDWDAVNHKFGALIPIYGTLVTAAIAMIVAVPVSFGIALFLTEVAPPWMRTPVGSAVELLAGIPSIIYGMWGLFVFVPFMGEYVMPWLDTHLGSWPISARSSAARRSESACSPPASCWRSW
jgi:phosphate transport system permease protein